MSNKGISNSEDVNEKFDIYLDAGSFSTIIIVSFSTAFIGYTNVRVGKGVEQSYKLYSAVLGIIFVISCALALLICVLSHRSGIYWHRLFLKTRITNL